MLDMILNNNLETPYNKFAPEGSVPIISKSLVKSKLSNKFHEIVNNHHFKNDEIFKANESEIIKDKLKSKEIFKNYEDDLYELKNEIVKLKNEIKTKDDVIKTQNEDKNKLENKIKELEIFLANLVKISK